MRLAAVLLVAASASWAQEPKKPFRPPKLRQGFTSGDLPSGSTTTARAAGQAPALGKPRALSRTPPPDLEPGRIKVPLTPYVWEPDAKVEKAPEPKPAPKPETQVWATIPEQDIVHDEKTGKATVMPMKGPVRVDVVPKGEKPPPP